jgi:hypothetical protein
MCADASDRTTVVLPAQPTPLVGRHRELEAVRELLLGAHVRLVTLVGPGGAGKTRLAVAVAETVTPTFADGVVFTDLSAAIAATEVVPTIARSLGLRDLGTRARLDGPVLSRRYRRRGRSPGTGCPGFCRWRVDTGGELGSLTRGLFRSGGRRE